MWHEDFSFSENIVLISAIWEPFSVVEMAKTKQAGGFGVQVIPPFWKMLTAVAALVLASLTPDDHNVVYQNLETLTSITKKKLL